MWTMKGISWVTLGADVCVAAIASVLMVDMPWQEEWVVFLLVIMCTLLR
jgi:hypothetical protein